MCDVCDALCVMFVCCVVCVCTCIGLMRNARCMHVYPHMSHSVCCVDVRVLCVCEGVVCM